MCRVGGRRCPSSQASISRSALDRRKANRTYRRDLAAYVEQVAGVEAAAQVRNASFSAVKEIGASAGINAAAISCSPPPTGQPGYRLSDDDQALAAQVAKAAKGRDEFGMTAAERKEAFPMGMGAPAPAKPEHYVGVDPDELEESAQALLDTADEYRARANAYAADGDMAKAGRLRHAATVEQAEADAMRAAAEEARRAEHSGDADDPVQVTRDAEAAVLQSIPLGPDAQKDVLYDFTERAGADPAAHVDEAWERLRNIGDPDARYRAAMEMRVLSSACQNPERKRYAELADHLYPNGEAGPNEAENQLRTIEQLKNPARSKLAPVAIADAERVAAEYGEKAAVLQNRLDTGLLGDKADATAAERDRALAAQRDFATRAAAVSDARRAREVTTTGNTFGKDLDRARSLATLADYEGDRPYTSADLRLDADRIADRVTGDINTPLSDAGSEKELADRLERRVQADLPEQASALAAAARVVGGPEGERLTYASMRAHEHSRKNLTARTDWNRMAAALRDPHAADPDTRHRALQHAPELYERTLADLDRQEADDMRREMDGREYRLAKVATTPPESLGDHEADEIDYGPLTDKSGKTYPAAVAARTARELYGEDILPTRIRNAGLAYAEKAEEEGGVSYKKMRDSFTADLRKTGGPVTAAEADEIGRNIRHRIEGLRQEYSSADKTPEVRAAEVALVSQFNRLRGEVRDDPRRWTDLVNFYHQARWSFETEVQGARPDNLGAPEQDTTLF